MLLEQLVNIILQSGCQVELKNLAYLSVKPVALSICLAICRLKLMTVGELLLVLEALKLALLLGHRITGYFELVLPIVHLLVSRCSCSFKVLPLNSCLI